MALVKKKKQAKPDQNTLDALAVIERFNTPEPLHIILARVKRETALHWFYQVKNGVYAMCGYADWYDEDQLIIVKRFKIRPS